MLVPGQIRAIVRVALVAAAFSLAPGARSAEAAPAALEAEPTVVRASQALPAGSTFEAALAAYESRAKARSPDKIGIRRADTALGMSVPYAELAMCCEPTYDSYTHALQAFRHIRDVRWLTHSSQPAFLRRSTWLYPDDGCFARSALAVDNLTAWGYPTPAKVFVFGALRAATKNTTSGDVQWWYHTAPLVAVTRADGEQAHYVFDPALNPRAPMPLGSWLAAMSDRPAALKVAICTHNTYEPLDSCRDAANDTSSAALEDQRTFLRKEWQRLETLGRSPTEELGDHPDWLSQQ